MTEIIAIAAVAKNNVIGKEGKIPWYIKEDFEHFKRLTIGHSCIMGMNTYESLPTKPLPKRENIVLTFDKDYNPSGTVVRHSFKEALDHCKGKDKVFICGGASVYKLGMEVADRLEITHIDKDYDGDTYFPKIDLDKWEVSDKEDHDQYSFVSYSRKHSI
ncbi:MAG: diacylglycerol kinase [Chloroflexi bacterium CG08_land_8_20_14_0_20_45_12]|nr:MAG: diacylglycerol kinase [Chloroflexi bacterium CG08_land_8_20_14_0_20_45_12]